MLWFDHGFQRQPDGRYTHPSGWFIVKAPRRGWWSIEHEDPARIISGQTIHKRLDRTMTHVLNRIAERHLQNLEVMAAFSQQPLDDIPSELRQFVAECGN